VFQFFKAAVHNDPKLGELKRSGGRWKGVVMLGPHGAVDLILQGDRSAPDAVALELAHELPERYAALRGEIQAGLFEHYEPYCDEVNHAPEIASAADVWSNVTVPFVRIEPLRTNGRMVMTVEIAYLVQWDEEHTLGARFQDWRLLETCGSI
jgi:hypothetical protein